MEKIKPKRLKDEEEPAKEQTDAEQDSALLAALPPTPLPSPVDDGPTSTWDRVRPIPRGAVVSKRSCGTLTPPRVTRGSSSGSLCSPRVKRNGSFPSLTSLRENTAAWSARLHRRSAVHFSRDPHIYHEPLASIVAWATGCSA